MPQIELQDIRKTFTVSLRPEGRFSALRGAIARKKKTVYALEGISFSIQQGELVGYIGPNGAGKSTTVKIMSGILTPDSGQCLILGRVPWKQRSAHVSHIGVVFGQRSQLWWDVPVRDSFELLRDIYGVAQSDYQKRLDELSGVLDIAALLSTPARQLSLGQRMRCEIAASLLHAPDILFLDEPTIGLDAVSKLALRQFLREKNRYDGVTMILTTHDMDDIECLCSRVMAIGQGRLLYDGSLQGLRRRYAPLRIIRARTAHPAGHTVINGAESVVQKDCEYLVSFDPAVIPPHEMIARVAKAMAVTDITVEETGTDEMIAAMYKSWEESR